MATLHLILKAQWYNMIEQGIKKEEYRDITPYYQKRLCNSFLSDYCKRVTAYCERACHYVIPNYTTVTFHYGYTSRIMKFKIDDVHIGKGNPDWGAEPDKRYFVITLGERIR